MMKTIAILLFSAFALTGCATDAPDDIKPIDKSVSDGDQLLDPAIAQWAKDYTSAPHPVAPAAGLVDWAEEIVIQDKIYTLLHGNFGALLLDALGDRVLTIPCHDCEPGF